SNLRTYQRVRSICAAFSEEAARRLIELARGPDERVAYMALTTILERGVGKPRDHAAEDEAVGRINLAALPEADQRLLVDLLKRARGMRGQAPNGAEPPVIDASADNAPVSD